MLVVFSADLKKVPVSTLSMVRRLASSFTSSFSISRRALTSMLFSPFSSSSHVSCRAPSARAHQA